MSEKSPNLDLMLYTNSDSTKKFGSWLEEMAGAGAGSNLMKIDSAFSEVREGLSQKADLQNGKVPASQLPSLSSNDFTTAEKEKLASLGKALNFSGAVSGAYNGMTDLSVTIPKSGRTCTFVVGTSTAGWTEADCDYLCDGVDDQIEINAALSALPAEGGEVKLLNGVYQVNAQIQVTNHKMLTGCGIGTKLKRVESNKSYLVRLGEYCELSHLWVEGLTDVNIASGLPEVHMGGGCSWVHHLLVSDARWVGIRDSGYENSISDCVIIACRLGVRSGSCSRVYGNCFEACAESAIDTGKGNYLVYGNTIDGMGEGNIGLTLSYTSGGDPGGSVYGNTIVGVGTGIYLNGAVKTVVSGNYIRNSTESGIAAWDAEQCFVTGNIVTMKDGLPEDYTDTQNSIYAYNCADCVFSNNLILGKNYVVEGGEGNEFYQNKYTRTEEATA